MSSIGVKTQGGGKKPTRGTSVVTHTVRTKDGNTKPLRMGRKLAVQAFCTECLGWEDEPRDCTAALCPLYPFRGKTLATQKGKKPPAQED